MMCAEGGGGGAETGAVGGGWEKPGGGGGGEEAGKSKRAGAIGPDGGGAKSRGEKGPTALIFLMPRHGNVGIGWQVGQEVVLLAPHPC
jgi:hypothetical protein